MFIMFRALADNQGRSKVVGAAGTMSLLLAACMCTCTQGSVLHEAPPDTPSKPDHAVRAAELKDEVGKNKVVERGRGFAQSSFVLHGAQHRLLPCTTAGKD